jgi:hypothetical protein
MSTIQIQTPPKGEPISLATLKQHLRVTISNDDALLQIYLQSAREIIESDTGRSLVNKLYRQTHDHFPRRHHDHGNLGTGYFLQQDRYARGHHYDEHQQIKLLRCPLVNVQKILYVDTNGVQQTLLPTSALDGWLAGNKYEIGDQIGDPNGNLQEVTAVNESETGGESQSGTTEPTFSASLNGTTTDHDIIWTTKRVPAPAGDFSFDADSEPPRVYPNYGQVWPQTQRVPNAVQIFFVAGYGDDAASAPANLKVGLMMAAGVSNEFREAVTREQLHALDWYERLVWSERVMDFAPTK